ncbi:MAG TPA: hypothetical protein VMU21_00300 [Thermodesulfovibrionales bacterium]|nr:hypothetical protein [Thermodesulfovibrionales bacterium]
MKKDKAKPLKTRRSKLKHLNAFLKEYQPIINALIKTLGFLVLLLASLRSCHDNRQVIENRMETDEREECVIESIHFHGIIEKVGLCPYVCPDMGKSNVKEQPRGDCP